ncbi:MAG: hypothetical protein ACF8K1_02415 [Phycisphaerales bacterium JB047]
MPDQTASKPDESPHPITGGRALVGLSCIGLLFVGVLLMRGMGGPWSARAATVLLTLIESGWAPLLYLLSALGLGRIARSWAGSGNGRWMIELGAGLTIAMTLTHLLGITGMLNPYTAWCITGLGLAMLSPALMRRGSINAAPCTLTPLNAVVVCGGLLALVMACNPPGWLWGSEYGGFDALSYHLQLPRDWIEQGRIWPSEDSVYSFLPSGIESVYMHLSLLMGGGMLDHNARPALSAQILSALMLILSAATIGALTRASMERVMPQSDARVGATLGAVLTLGTPWLLVVGTLGYNEIAVVLLGSCTLLVAMRTDIDAWKRAVLCGLIVGGACSCKPTALFLLAPTVGVVLLASMPKRHWISATLLCCIVGALTIAPWLIRNELATGNPVFPQMRGVFGDGHWNDAQHAIYKAAHTFDGSVLDRFALLVLPDPDGIDHVSRFRGLTNRQWGPTPLLGLIGLLSLLLVRSTHRAGALACAALLLPIVAWAMLTHLQSRFLIPLAPILIVLGAMGIARIANQPARMALSRVVGLMALMSCTALAMVQQQGNPFLMLDLGPALSLGELEIDGAPWTATLNQITNDDEAVYLLGDATPFYVQGDVHYNTVYDRWLIEDAISAYPDDPQRWTGVLQEAGIDVIVIGFSEINRYARSGWLPESIDPQQLIEWIDSLGEPIQVWSSTPDIPPIRAVYRIHETSP